VTSSPPRVYLDANVFIAAFEHAGAHSDHAWWILVAIEKGEIVGATSEATLAEVLVKPMQRGAEELAAAYDEMIVPGPNFEVLPVGRDVLVKAAGIRAGRPATRLPDAIHIASALAMNCMALVSADRRINVPDGLMLLEVSPFTLDDIFDGRP
jgi:predicted nucleic acid-binding protein